jgi:photosystem II stability/assembly factor-like uncharacterized protein
MAKSFMSLGRQWLLMGVLGLMQVAAQSTKLPPPKLAQKLGISVQQVHSLEARFQLTDEQLLALPRVQLQMMLVGLEHPGVAKHEDQQQFQMLRLKNEHGQIPPEGLMHAMTQRMHVPLDSDLFPATPDPSPVTPSAGTVGPGLAGLQNGGWTWLGPGNIGGRVRSILVHPTVTSTLWCGGVDGGVWKSTNSGAAWFPLNDFMANLAIASMVLDPTNPNILYAGTGEAMYNFDAIRGAGIFKSTDGGTTWYQLPSTINTFFQYVGRLAVCPTNHLVLLAATRSGVFRSVDGGTNWTQRLTTECVDVTYHPSDGSQALASGYDSQAFYSQDGGQSWTAASGFPVLSGFVVGRIELAYAPSNPNVVFASVDNNSGEMYMSTDGGRNFALRSTGYQYLGGQGWYDNVIWVDPTVTNVLVVGGIDLWRSTDGGVTLTKISDWQLAPASAHADHHAIVSVPGFNGASVRTVYFGNDGGVYRAADVYTVSQNSGWQELNNNLGLTQFYGGAGNVTSGVVVGGTQDNGSLRYTPGGGPQGWTAVFGGDGGFAGADSTSPLFFYGEYVYLYLHRSTDGGASANYIYTGISDSGVAANFIAPFILDPNNPNTLLGGGSRLWRSTNVKAATPTWTSIKPAAGANISAIAVAPGNSAVIWVGHNNGAIYSTANGTAATPTWTLRSAALPARYCGRIAINPFNANKVYAVFGGYSSGNVWRTTDGGVSWTDLSANLPAAPVNTITLAPGVTNTLYVGTDVGIFGTTNDGTAWSTGNDGPANVATEELFWMGNKLVAVTHGRGMFSITPALGGVNLVAAGSIVPGGNGNGNVDPNECNPLYLVLQNIGGMGASNLTATLTTTTPGVSVIQGASAYPNALAAGGPVTNTTPFQLSTAPGFVCGTPISLTLNVVYNVTSNSSVAFSMPSGGGTYVASSSSGASIVPGSTDIGNHGDDVVTTITLPFSWNFYGRPFTNATLSSNGNLQFFSGDNNYNNSCLPYAGFNYAICPLWDDLRTDTSGSGIFTSLSGSAPNRIFNLEWRATFFSSGATANFEVRLYEGQPRFDIVYGALNDTGSSATVGVQSDIGNAFTNYECNAGGLSAGLQLSFQAPCTDGGGTCSAGPVVILQPAQQGTNFVFFFATLAGKTYTVQYKNVLDNSSWQPAKVYAGDGATKQFTTPILTAGRQFFRLSVQ